MYLNDDFLLSGDLARDLYSEVKDLPIIDFHNHLSPKEIYENKPYDNIANLWLDHDHYKWRLMRASGIPEELITGNAEPLAKFKAYANALEHAYLNPLHHWSHMELKTYFGITDILTAANAEELYEKANQVLANRPLGPRELLIKLNVESLNTTDDLNDDLAFHELIANDKSFDIKVLPTFRPDSLFAVAEESFLDVIGKLEASTKTTITGVTTLATALSLRLDYFESKGCKVADHGLSKLVHVPVTKSEASKILKKRLQDIAISPKEVYQLQVFLLEFLLKEYGRRGWVCQLHLGALRDNNIRMFNQLGKDSGFDSISDHAYIADLNRLLAEAGRHFDLPKLILYNLNPRDNEAIAATCGNFNSDLPGRVQFGAPWWFNDHHNGIKNHLKVYAAYLNLSQFVGMTTDSRSFLSFVRHDYFRRILCDFLAKQANKGLIPKDVAALKQVVKNISYDNAKRFFSN